MKNILKISFCVLTAIVFCTSATKVASAKTINNNFSYLDSSRLDFFENIFKRSNYNSYLLATETITNGYSTYSNYYFCLSSDLIDASNTLSSKLNCNEMYRYSRNSSNDYTIEKINDNELVVNNSIYYSNSLETKNISIKMYLAGILFGIFSIFLIFVLSKIFGL